jgi:simple sugar transport system permease protein
VTGENINAAEYAGMNHKKTLIITMIISAGLAGLAGAGLITGLQHRLQSPDAISPGYGFTAIIVAWLGGLNPIFIILSAIFMSILIVGGQQIQIALGLPFGVVNVFNGVILAVLIAFEFIKKYEIKISLNKSKNLTKNSNKSG